MCGEGEGESEEWFPSAIITPRLTARLCLSYLPGILLPFFSSLSNLPLFPPSSLSFSWQLFPHPLRVRAPSCSCTSPFIHPFIHPCLFLLWLPSSPPPSQSAVTFFLPPPPVFFFFLFSLNAFLSRSFCVLFTLPCLFLSTTK